IRDRTVTGVQTCAFRSESQGSTVRYLDTYGHGTHMAGIMVGNDTSVSFKGLAPGAKLSSVKAGTAVGSVDVSQMLAAIDWVVQRSEERRVGKEGGHGEA